MYSWRPGAIASLYDHLAVNDVFAYKADQPDVTLIVCFRHPPNWQQNPAETARQLGQYIAGKWPELKALDPFIYFANQLNTHYENGDPNPANQPLYTTPEFYQRYASWLRTVADVIKNLVPEMKLVTPPFAFGYNEDGSPDLAGKPTKGWAGYDFLYETVRDYFDNIVTFHAFWGYPAGGSVPDWLYEPELASWYAFRWRRLLQLFETRYQLKTKVIIDRAANFGPADPDFTTEQLIYYAGQCLSDERVIALTYFLWADPAQDPRYRPNAWVGGVPNLADHLNRLKNLPDFGPVKTVYDIDANDLTGILEYSDLTGQATTLPQSSPVAPVAPDLAAQTIRVLFENGSVQTMRLEEYLRSVVPSEMPTSWPDEALNAQAVAARSYAQYAIEHPRHQPQADICTTTHCQYYDSSKIDPASDQAIQRTTGIVVLFEDKTVNTVFSARCGGHTRNNEDVWSGGKPVPYLRGVPCPDSGEKQGHGVGFCQHGGRVLALQGRTYDEILKHYYQGVNLGPARPTKT
jgi:hypothetical protein